jgi:predicted membrane protein
MNTDMRPSFRVTPQIIFGLCIIAFGVALTGDNLGWIDAGRIWRYWPLAIVAIGLTKIFQSPTTSGRVFGGFITFVGVAMLAEFLNVFDLWAWWPVGMIVFGFMLITRAFGGPRRPVAGAMGTSMSPSTSDVTLSEIAFWSGVQRRVSSTFRQADLTAIMGGIELDLRQATTGGAEAVIDVFVMWGGIEIRVPPDWSVSNQIVPIMGGAEDKSSGTQASQNRLVLRGFAIMGGVEIKT